MKLLIPILLLLLITLFLFAIAIAGTPRGGPPLGAVRVEAAPAALIVLAMTLPDGVLVSWNERQERALVFRQRPGEHSQFVGEYSGIAVTDCAGQSGDVYRVQAWDAEGTTLIGEGAALAQWRMLLVSVGR